MKEAFSSKQEDEEEETFFTKVRHKDVSKRLLKLPADSVLSVFQNWPVPPTGASIAVLSINNQCCA